MNSIHVSGGGSYALWKRIGRHFLACLSIAIMIIGNPAYVKGVDFYSDIVLHMERTSLSNVLSRIESMTPYTFIYNKDLVDPSMNISINVKGKNIEEVLDKVFDGTDIKYKVAGTQIALQKATTQQKKKTKVSSLIVDENGLPMPGVNVIVKGTTQGVITSMDGTFTLVCEPNSILTFSFMGYEKKEYSLSQKLPAKIVLVEDKVNIDEVVVTALGIKREKKVLGYSVQEVSGAKLNETSNSDVTSALQGKVAGVQISQSSTGLGGSSKIPFVVIVHLVVTTNHYGLSMVFLLITMLILELLFMEVMIEVVHRWISIQRILSLSQF